METKNVTEILSGSSLNHIASIVSQRTDRAIGSVLFGTPDEVLAAIKAANWVSCDEPGTFAPAITFETTLPMAGVIGLIRFGDLTSAAQAAVVWLDAKGTEGTLLGGALPCVPRSLLTDEQIANLPTSNRAILMAGPKEEPGQEHLFEFWTMFPQPRGMVIPQPQPKEVEADSMIKIIWNQ